MAQILGPHHLNLTVPDVKKSAAWYRDVLQLEDGWEIDDAQQRKIILLIPDSAFRLVLSQHRSGSGDRFDETRTGLDHFAFTVEDRAALEEWEQRFEDMGVDHSPIKEGATGWLITFRDPDNTQLEVYTLAK